MYSGTAHLPAATRLGRSARDRLWVSSVLAAAVFWTALLAFGAIRPGYRQFTKAVSELGALGAPHALAWNLIGFIVPGLLLAHSGAGIAAAFDRRGSVSWWALIGSGVAFAGTGVFPAIIVDGDPVMRRAAHLGARRDDVGIERMLAGRAGPADSPVADAGAPVDPRLDLPVIVALTANVLHDASRCLPTGPDWASAWRSPVTSFGTWSCRLPQLLLCVDR